MSKKVIIILHYLHKLLSNHCTLHSWTHPFWMIGHSEKQLSRIWQLEKALYNGWIVKNTLSNNCTVVEGTVNWFDIWKCTVQPSKSYPVWLLKICYSNIGQFYIHFGTALGQLDIHCPTNGHLMINLLAIG